MRDAARIGIKYLTVYGFSTENWKRSGEEVGALMRLFRYYMVRLLKIAKTNNVRVRMIGERAVSIRISSTALTVWRERLRTIRD